MKSNRLPDFILIGGSKCGSTSLFEYLSQHNEISACKIKEPHFFTKKWDKGIGWYKSRFWNNSKLKFEGSTSYSNYPWYKETPKRIKELLPEAKLIYIVRHPIKRLVSQVHHNMIMGRLDMEEVNMTDFWTKRGGRYINLSMYYMQIEHYLKYFDRSQLHVLTLEELSSQPDVVLGDLAEFLGVSPEFFSKMDTSTRYNVSGNRNRIKRGVLYKGLRFLQRVIGNRTDRSRVKNGVARPEISENSIDFIWSVISDDVKKFEEFMGRDIGYIDNSISTKE